MATAKENEKPTIRFSHGKVDRRFDKEWAESGIINMDRVPMLVESLIDQRQSMMAYIEILHNTIDTIREKNHICDVAECFTANCGSDHK